MSGSPISIITPVFEPPEDVLRAMLDSVRAQTSDAWEHCIADDCSTAPHVRPMLEEAAARDQRVKVRFRSEQGGIVAATNDALGSAGHPFVGFLDHDDVLHPHAISRVQATLTSDASIDYVYTDDDKIDDRGRRFDPLLKPDWSPDRFRAQMYPCHFSVARRALVHEVGGMRPGLDGSQDWDLVLRLTERTRRIAHVPEVLYHWRVLPSSVASDSMAKPWAHDAARRAITDHLDRTGVQAEVADLEGYPGQYRIRPAIREEPLVSIVIPTGGGVRAVHGRTTNLVVHTVRSIVERTRYVRYEIVVVADDDVPDTVIGELREVAGSRIRVVPFAGPFNFSAKVNLGAAHARGDYLLILNDDVEVLWPGWRESWPKRVESSTWIEALLCYAQQEGVGSVGAKLYYADRRIQHVGIVAVGIPAHPYRGFHRDYIGYFANAILPGNYLAVTGACVMTPRAVFEEVGGFSREFPLNYQDVDYGLKVRARALRTVFTPEAELIHYEGSTRSVEVHTHETERLRARWGAILDGDPYYNPQFVPGQADFVHPPYTAEGEFVKPSAA